MWKFLNSLGVMRGILRERSAEVQNITSRATAFRHHYDSAMLVATELHDMIAKSQRDLNDAFTRLRAAVPASPPSHLITEDNVITEESASVPAGDGNGRARKSRTWSSAA
jgi:hypothetical protein